MIAARALSGDEISWGPQLARGHQSGSEHGAGAGEDQGEPDTEALERVQHDADESHDRQKQVVETLIEGEFLCGQGLFLADPERRPGPSRRSGQRFHHPDVHVQQRRETGEAQPCVNHCGT